MTQESGMSPEVAEAAMERIIEGLTEPQQMALVAALRQRPTSDRMIQVSANERTIGSLIRGQGPLIAEVGARRMLTPLGEHVARHLAATRQFRTLPDVSSVLPALPKPGSTKDD